MGHLTASFCMLRRGAARAMVAALGAVAAAAIAGAAAADDDPVAWGYSMAHELMSPFCPGRTLSQCPSPQAGELRQWIILQAAAGATREEVEAQLLARFGDEILQAPRAEGWGASAYAIPIVFFLAAGGLVALLLKRLVRSQGSAPAPAPNAPFDSELEHLVDQELGQG